MRYLIDGTNFLGRTRVDRTDAEIKRNLVRVLASFARANRHTVVCVFDGDAPASFATNLGAINVQFSGRQAADDLIAARAEKDRVPQTVVTSDLGLAARVKRRQVTVVSCEAFRSQLETAGNEAGAAESTDWEAYFSDEKNRNV